MEASNKKTKKKKTKKTTLTLSLNDIGVIWAALEVDIACSQEHTGDGDDRAGEWNERVDECEKLITRLNKAYDRCKNKK